jgi:hypothetical protein
MSRKTSNLASTSAIVSDVPLQLIDYTGFIVTVRESVRVLEGCENGD